MGWRGLDQVNSHAASAPCGGLRFALMPSRVGLLGRIGGESNEKWPAELIPPRARVILLLVATAATSYHGAGIPPDFLPFFTRVGES